jgi:hypothetical protein
MSDNAQPAGGLKNGEDPGGLPPRDDAADQAALEDPATWDTSGSMRVSGGAAGAEPSQQPAPPANNVMLHGYAVLGERHAALLRDMKDSGLGLWNLLRIADESGTDAAWNSRELELASLRLEEALMWAEKHFVM